MTDPVLSTLGLCLRSGNLAVGEKPVEDVCGSRRARLVLLASDAAENTADRGRRLAERCGAPVAVLPREKSQMGAALGRRVCALAAVTDPGLALLMIKKLAGTDPEQYDGLLKQMQETCQARTPAGHGGGGAKKRNKRRGSANRRWPA